MKLVTSNPPRSLASHSISLFPAPRARPPGPRAQGPVDACTAHQFRSLKRRLPRAPRASGEGDARPSDSRAQDRAQPTSMLHYTWDTGVDLLAGVPMVLSPEERIRLNEQDDSEFYRQPRFVAHTDEAYTRSLTALYRSTLRPGSTVLDLMSSWQSHLPMDIQYESVLGIGMNADELSANKRLTKWLVQDLNREPGLTDIPTSSVDAVVCSKGLQYLTRPETVLREVLRVLRPLGCVIITFSRHCWADKATSAWLQRDSRQRMQLVAKLLQAAGLETVRYSHMHAGHSASTNTVSTTATQPMSQASQGTQVWSDQLPDLPADSETDQDGPDPLYAVIAYKATTVLNPPSDKSYTQPTVGYAYINGASSSASPAGPTNQERASQRDTELLSADVNASDVAASYVAAPLREMELFMPGHTEQSDKGAKHDVREETLVRWRIAYQAMCSDAQALGIPRSAIPPLPPNASAESIRQARDHLEAMMASFLSAGL